LPDPIEQRATRTSNRRDIAECPTLTLQHREPINSWRYDVQLQLGRALARPGVVAAATLTLAVSPAAAQTRPLPQALQMRLAVQAAPPAMRDSATVQGYDASGAFVTLRKGTNDLICMAPDPNAKHFEVSCHQAGLEPFFARGRELTAQGITGERRRKARWDEITAGKLSIPYGAANTIITGSGFDTATAEIHDPFVRWVIYTPGATSASTGLSDQPAGPGAPWLMFPGTPGAHIMITPPRPK
jgi:hypothetical protein